MFELSFWWWADGLAVGLTSGLVYNFVFIKPIRCYQFSMVRVNFVIEKHKNIQNKGLETNETRTFSWISLP